jgi:flagellar hook-associated protein 1 FlgK
MSGLFSTFNVAKRGINTAQTTIDVTSHNIANANTDGYSRQVAEVVTTRPMTPNGFKGQIGTGAEVQSIERVRDTFLDYQVRGESSILGNAKVRNDVLYEVESIFNEPSDTGISTLMGKFFDSFQELSKQANSSNARTVVAQQTLALTDALNHTATKLEELENNSKTLLRTDATDINSILSQVDVLNNEIKAVKTSGHNANDLMDKRDLLLDNLSSKFNISVDKKSFDGIDVRPTDSGKMVSVKLVSSNQDEEAARFSYISSIEQDPSYPSVKIITYYKLGDMSSDQNKQTIRVSNLTDEQVKELDSSRLIWANESGQAIKGDGYPINNNQIINAQELMVFKPTSGEVAGNITVQDDIRNYRDQLDKLAKSLAYCVNSVHSGMSNPMNTGNNPERDYMPFFVNSDVVSYNSSNELSNLEQTLAAEPNITAKNITINKEILSDVMKIKTKTHDNDFAYSNQNDVDGEGDGARALAIAKLRDSLIRVQDFGEAITGREDIQTTNYGMTIENDNSGMKMDSYFKDIIDRLGVQAQEANRQQTNQEKMVTELENSKASVSGVSLDEEMANLVQFQHAYTANAKIISTLDELLDVVINGLKR